MATIVCRRCLTERDFDLNEALDSGGVPECGACGRPVVSGERRERCISAANYIRNADVRTMRSIRRVPGLVHAVQMYAKAVTDDDLLLDRYADDVRISSSQLPEIYELYLEAGRRLGLPSESMPPLFLEGSREPGAATGGVERPFVILTAGLLEVMTPGEILAVMGHELGHVQAGHFTYTTAIRGVRQIIGRAAKLSPVAFDDLLVELLGDPLLLAWVRAAERTADRAGMIAARRPRDMVTAMMKIAGAPPTVVAELNYEAFAEQASEFEQLVERSTRRRLLVAKDIINRSHPFPAVRVAEMVELLDSTEWLDIQERVLDSSPGRWERACANCAGTVADWDVVCRHCAWTVPESEGESDVGPTDAEAPPDPSRWREQLVTQSRKASSWRPPKWSRGGGDGAEDVPDGD
jgi:Zn-dependent protease with chaperone function